MSEKFRNIPSYRGIGYIVLPETVLVVVPVERYASVRELSNALVSPSLPVGIYGVPFCSSERRCDIKGFDYEAARSEKIHRDIDLEVFRGKDDSHYTIRCCLYPAIQAGVTREELEGQDYTCWDRVEAIATFTGGTIESGSITVPRKDAA